MITEDYVSLETAKLLKEKGFRKHCLSAYYPKPTVRIECPTLQMAMKWLRKVHKIHISVEMGFDVDNPQYYFFIPSVCRFSDKSGEYENPFGEKEFNAHEEACEAAIKYCLENLI